MNADSQETLLEKNAILDAINSMRQEINGRLDKIEARLTNVDARLTTVETDVAEIKNLQFSFDVRLERIQGAAHKSLSIGHNLRADVKTLHAEVGTRTKNVMRLETQLA